MGGRSAVWQLRTRLDSTFGRATTVADDPEMQSHYARYLCVLVSGYIEQAIKELLLEHSRLHSSPSVLKFVERQIGRPTNMKAGRLVDLLGAFDDRWRSDLDVFLVDERKDAMDSVVALRNRIAHGESVGVTLQRIRSYYEQVQIVVDHVADLCVPRTP